MSDVWCVRAEGGRYSDQFVKGGYVAIGWGEIDDLSSVVSRDELYQIYKDAYPNETSNLVVGQQVGQIARFLFEIKADDYVITPDMNTELLHYGRVSPTRPSYFYATAVDGCPFQHRRHVEWAKHTLKRSGLSVPFQNTMRALFTVFAVSQRDEFLTAIGQITPVPASSYDPYHAVLEQILKLNDKEFEILVGHLLTALGFEGSEVIGKSGDGGVDATGELNVANLAKVKVFVQAKRYQIGSKVSAATVRQLRQAIPFGGQGAFITTADYQNSAADVAIEPNFPRIGLINGSQLVDLLIENWNSIPQEFRNLLGLKPGLVRE